MRDDPLPDDPLPAASFNREAELLLAPRWRPGDGDSAWWNTRYGRWRVAAEADAMRRHFPGFRAHLLEPELLSWSGRLESALVLGNRYFVRVTYPPCFPDMPPEVAILDPEISPDGTPHLLPGRRPCLFDPGGSGYEPARTTAATLVAWTALWIHAYETW